MARSWRETNPVGSASFPQGRYPGTDRPLFGFRRPPPFLLLVGSTHDLRRDPPELPRFLRPAGPHDRAVGVAAARLPGTALHERGHEPVRADLPRRPRGGRLEVGRGP